MAVSGIEVFYVVFVAMESGFPEAIAETLAKLNLGLCLQLSLFLLFPRAGSEQDLAASAS